MILLKWRFPLRCRLFSTMTAGQQQFIVVRSCTPAGTQKTCCAGRKLYLGLRFTRSAGGVEHGHSCICQLCRFATALCICTAVSYWYQTVKRPGCVGWQLLVEREYQNVKRPAAYLCWQLLWCMGTAGSESKNTFWFMDPAAAKEIMNLRWSGGGSATLFSQYWETWIFISYLVYTVCLYYSPSCIPYFCSLLPFISFFLIVLPFSFTFYPSHLFTFSHFFPQIAFVNIPPLGGIF